MKNSAYLFHLIQSMTKRDKDNLLRYARVRGKKIDHKYLDLFHAISAQREYDEHELREQFGVSNFSEAKSHLTRLILKVLRIYHEHPETQMQNSLAEIRILLSRSMYHFAVKKIRKAREIALEEERYGDLNRLADYELEALPFVADPKKVHARRTEIVQLRDEAEARQRLINRLKEIQDKELGKVLNQASLSGRFSSDLVEVLERLPELQVEDTALPVRARSIKYRIWNVIHHHRLDFVQRVEALDKLVHLFDEHPFLIREEENRYVFALGGYGMCLNVVGRYQEALEATSKLRAMKTESPNLLRSIFLNYATNISIYTLNTGDIGPFNDNLSFLLASLRLHRDHTPAATLTYIQYLLAIDFWLAGDILRANRLARRVVDHPSGRANLQAACRCFLLIFAFEEKDPEAIIRYVRNWNRQWKKKASPFKVDQLFAQFMVRLVDLAHWEDINQAMQDCKSELEELLKGGFEVRADNFIFLLHWLEAKLKRISLVEVVAKK